MGIIKKRKTQFAWKSAKSFVKSSIRASTAKGKTFPIPKFYFNVYVDDDRIDWQVGEGKSIRFVFFVSFRSDYYGVFHSLIFLGSFCKLDWTLCIHRRTFTWLVIVMKHIEFAFYFHLQERFQSWFPYFFAARLLQPLRVRETFFK